MAELSLEEQLTKMGLKDVSEYSLGGKRFIGKVVDVYDGDTCKIILLQDGSFVRYTCRLIGIDTPEMKTKSEGAYKARNRLIQLATNIPIELDNRGSHVATTKLIQANTKLVRIACKEFDKYGRLLVKIYECSDSDCIVDFNTMLVNEKLANSYDGGQLRVHTELSQMPNEAKPHYGHKEGFAEDS